MKYYLNTTDQTVVSQPDADPPPAGTVEVLLVRKDTLPPVLGPTGPSRTLTVTVDGHDITGTARWLGAYADDMARAYIAFAEYVRINRLDLIEQAAALQALQDAWVAAGRPGTIYRWMVERGVRAPEEGAT